MKLFFTILLVVLQLNNNCKDLPQVRTLFQASINEEKLNKMIAVCKMSNCIKITPYYAAATMKSAEFVWSPLKKLINFKKGKKMLDNFILKYPNNIEARYVRWLTQKKAPTFLNYNQHLKEDYLFIMNNLENSNIDPDYKKTIMQHVQKIENE